MEIFTKKQLVEELNGILKLVKKMPADMYFHANVEFSGVDKKFMQLSQQYNIEKYNKLKKKQEDLKQGKPEANI